MKTTAYLLTATLALCVAGCSSPVNPRVATALNQDAALIGELPANPLQAKVITSWIDKQQGTMSTMFGNDIALQHARSSQQSNYPAGSVLSVATWSQQEDPRWFGGKIPAAPKSVEVITVGNQYMYERYNGSPLKKVAREQTAVPGERAAYLLSQRAAVIP